MIINIREYKQSKANGILEKIRGDKIAQLVRKKYTPSDEARLVFNMISEPHNSQYVHEFVEHEEYVKECKDAVDRAFAEIERIYNDEIPNT